jgi:hypothetical protein
MIFEDPLELRARCEEVSGRRFPGPIRIVEDTSSYMSIDYGNVLRLDDADFLVLGNLREGRFGIDEQPKFWVKSAIDLATGDKKIIKLVFYEQFKFKAGMLVFKCKRTPAKESAILDLTRGLDRYMQGYTVIDKAGNAVRILDYVRGRSLFNYIPSIDMPHEQYFHEALPAIMQHVIPCIEAIAFLHEHGQQHGDIRNDHIIIDRETGDYIWIDFDYEANYGDFDIWSMGNVINYVVGKGIHAVRQIWKIRHLSIEETDTLLLHKYRLANLKKLFPYIPKDLNDILMRFSVGTNDFYEDLRSQANDLKEVFPAPPSPES